MPNNPESNILKTSLTLGGFCLVAAVLLALISATAPAIDQFTRLASTGSSRAK